MISWLRAESKVARRLIGPAAPMGRSQSLGQWPRAAAGRRKAGPAYDPPQPFSPTISSACAARSRRSRAFVPRYISGSSTFSSAEVRASRLKPLEHEAQEVAAQARARCLRLNSPTSTPLNRYDPPVGTSRAAEDVHARRLAGSARTHDGHKLAMVDAEIHPGQRQHHALALAVGFGHAAETRSPASLVIFPTSSSPPPAGLPRRCHPTRSRSACHW